MLFDFEASYAGHSTEALLAIVKNRESYQPEAVAAAEALLAKRPPSELVALLAAEPPVQAKQTHPALSELLERATEAPTGFARLRANFSWEAASQSGAHPLLLLGTFCWCAFALYFLIRGVWWQFPLLGSIVMLFITVYTGAGFLFLVQGNRWGWLLSAVYGFWLVWDLAGRLFWRWVRDESLLELFSSPDVVLLAAINIGNCVLLLRKDIREHYEIGSKALKQVTLISFGLFAAANILRMAAGQ